MPAPAPISICPSWRAATKRRCGATSSLIPRSGSASTRGTIKATVLIETLPAAFEMDEILHALRDNIVGLNCGRWDYIFSYIKRLGRSPDRLTPDRSAMTMDKAFLAAYSLRLIATCHRRGAFAMGGMSAFIPVKGDEAANQAALDKVRADKLREVGNGHDGTWVAHPALVPVALEAFAAMDGPNQLSKIPDRIPGRDEMLELHTGPAHRSRRPREYPRRRPVHRRLAQRPRRGAALQSDGRRRDRRNLPRPALAMAASSKRRSTTAAASASTCSRIGWPRSWPRSATSPTSTPPPACCTNWSPPTSSRNS